MRFCCKERLQERVRLLATLGTACRNGERTSAARLKLIATDRTTGGCCSVALGGFEGAQMRY